MDVANRGGDSDTNGAITGALLGARFGLKGVPPEWVERVEKAAPFKRIPADLSPAYFRTFVDL